MPTLTYPSSAARCAPPSAPDRDLARVLAAASNAHMRRTGTAQHAQRVARLAAATALELDHPADAIARIRMAALVHDAGKAWIPARVLLKPGPLAIDEWMLIEAHPITGAGMLLAPQLADIAEWVLCHHERPDGRGYPHGRCGDDIPVEALIISVCDAFDAMTSARPNSPSLPFARAIHELIDHSGEQFDAGVVAAFRSVVHQRA
jgi:HD-GYP domain-containing protein (c-di-GMP phosphodiesterase class II)